MLSQTLNLLNEKEQSRFEAFTRCTFSGDAVSNFIAACLIHSKEQSEFRRVHNLHLIGGDANGNGGKKKSGIQIGSSVTHDDAPESISADGNNSVDNGNTTANIIDATTPIIMSHQNYTTTPPLSDLVAPGTASKITSVVTTIAKIHAQRLVQSARSIASAQGYNTNEKLQMHHLMEAHRARSKQHARSGFFMQSQSSRSQFQSNYCHTSIDGNFSAAFGRVDKSRLQYQAALQAQKIYDKIIHERTGQEEDDDDGEDKSMETKDNVGEDKSMETKDNDGEDKSMETKDKDGEDKSMETKDNNGEDKSKETKDNDEENGDGTRMDTSDDDGKGEDGNKDCNDDKKEEKEKDQK